MDIKEIVFRESGSSFEQRELEFVVESYLKETTGKDVTLNYFDNASNFVVARSQLNKMDRDFYIAAKYYCDKFNNEKSKENDV